MDVFIDWGLYSIVNRKSPDSINPSPKTASLIYIGFRRPHPKALFRQACHSTLFGNSVNEVAAQIACLRSLKK
jgi:hypothetical protein